MTAFSIAPEQGAHNIAIEALHADAFGPGRFTRAAFRLREQGPHDVGLSLVALDGAGDLIGSVRLTPVRTATSGHHGFLLGPLAVAPAHKNQGIGKALVTEAVAAAAVRSTGTFVLLVGDAPYYAPLGFAQTRIGAVTMPGPVDPNRLLAHPLGHDGVVEALAGMVGFLAW